jgi:chemotaxis protein CheD
LTGSASVTDLAASVASEVIVRMSEIAVSAVAGDELLSVGLGSCIGLALVCRGGGACGLAHVMLPESGGRAADRPGKYGDRAVPELVGRLKLLGVAPRALDAIVVGGAQMFADASTLSIGARNEAAVRAALARARIPVLAAATGGAVGRTIRVQVATGIVTVREAGAQEVTLR